MSFDYSSSDGSLLMPICAPHNTRHLVDRALRRAMDYSSAKPTSLNRKSFLAEEVCGFAVISPSPTEGPDPPVFSPITATNRTA